MTVLEKILWFKQERNWTEYRLSEESGIPQTTISSWFRKNVNPSIASLEKLCDAFHITLSQFFAEDGEQVALTEPQKQLVAHWNRLNPAQQQIILDLLVSIK
ncbi:MAG: helix-turn-helix transcriptional regulator [Oscillospiraceae bacterium]